jgi:hypothetical protein
VSIVSDTILIEILALPNASNSFELDGIALAARRAGQEKAN